MKKKNRLKVSVASDIIRDRMTVEIHENDRILVEGVISEERTVIFRSAPRPSEFEIEEVREVFEEFLAKMDLIENT